MTAARETEWSKLRSRQARAVVRFAVIDSLVQVRAMDYGDDESWSQSAVTLAGILLRKLGLPPIGKDLLARELAIALDEKKRARDARRLGAGK